MFLDFRNPEIDFQDFRVFLDCRNPEIGVPDFRIFPVFRGSLNPVKPDLDFRISRFQYQVSRMSKCQALNSGFRILGSRFQDQDF